MPMKDILIAIIILLTLIAGFSQCDTPLEQNAPPANIHGSGLQEPGESEEIEQGEGDLPITLEQTIPPDYTELALEVINGDWGNGYIRKQRLCEAGHDAKAVQEVVNNILK